MKLPLPQTASDRLRTLLKIRKPRSIPKRGPRPNIGARIFHDDVRMSVYAGLTPDLWRWLQQIGWREVTFRPDRRRYCDVPTDCVTKLYECIPEQREEVLKWCVARARQS